MGFWDWVLGILTDIGTAIGAAAEAVWAALVAVWSVVEPIFRPLEAVGKALWNDVLKPFWLDLEQWYCDLRLWWDHYIPIVERWFDTIHDTLQNIYDTIFRPVLDGIQKLQQFLELTHLANTDFGHALDQLLGAVRADINGIYQSISQPINEIVHTIENVIFDANGFIQAPLLIGSLVSNIGDVWNLLWWAISNPISAVDKGIIRKAGTRPTIQGVTDSFQMFLLEHSGPLEPAITAGEAAFMAVLNGDDPPGLDPVEPDI